MEVILLTASLNSSSEIAMSSLHSTVPSKVFIRKRHPSEEEIVSQ